MFELIAELIASFFLFVIVLTTHNPLYIGLAVIVGIVFCLNFGSGQLNPCISFLLYLNNQLSLFKTLQYISVQFLGAILAYYFISYY